MTTALWTWKSVRFRVSLCIALALTIEGLMRSNLNMAMVCMLTEESLRDGKTPTNISDDSECLILRIGSEKVVEHRGTLEWNSKQRAYIFTSFYAGGLFSCFVTELLSRRFGPKLLVLHGAIANVVGTFATPAVASLLGPEAMILIRFLMGFGQGLLWPCMTVLVGHWFPATEKSTALAITTTGNQLSVIIAMFATAELCQLPIGEGWPMAFHVYGVMGVLLCMLWWYCIEDSPVDHPRICEDEIRYICSGLTATKQQKANWMKLLRSPLIWSIAATSFAHNFITVGTVTYLPLYYKTVLKMSLTSNGILSAVPFIFQFFSKILYAGFADGTKKLHRLSFTTITKICNTSASLGLALCFGLLCFCDCTNRNTAVVLVCLAMAFVSGYIPGYNTSIVTVAPRQTAAIASFTRLWGQVAASVAPAEIGAVTKHGTLDEWRIVFITIVILCIVSGIAFQVYGSADPQPWAEVPNSDFVVDEELIEKGTEADENVVGS